MSVFLLNSSTAEVETSRRRLKLKPRPHLCGAWPVKLQPQKTFEYLSSVCNVRVVILQTVCWTSDLCEYCCAQCCTIRSTAVQCGTAVSILVLLQYVQSCSMLMFLSVRSLISRRRCDSLHAEQKLPGERSVCSCGGAFLLV